MNANKLKKILIECKQFKCLKFNRNYSSIEYKIQNEENSPKRLHTPVMLNEIIKFLIDDMDSSCKVGIKSSFA